MSTNHWGIVGLCFIAFATAVIVVTKLSYNRSSVVQPTAGGVLVAIHGPEQYTQTNSWEPRRAAVIHQVDNEFAWKTRDPEWYVQSVKAARLVLDSAAAAVKQPGQLRSVTRSMVQPDGYHPNLRPTEQDRGLQAYAPAKVVAVKCPYCGGVPDKDCVQGPGIRCSVEAGFNKAWMDWANNPKRSEVPEPPLQPLKSANTQIEIMNLESLVKGANP